MNRSQFSTLVNKSRSFLSRKFSHYIEDFVSIGDIPYLDIIGEHFKGCSLSVRSRCVHGDYTICVKVSSAPYWCAVILYCYSSNNKILLFDFECV